MPPASKTKKSHEAKPKEPTLCSALNHPLRTRILEVVNEVPMSPSAFVDAGLVPPSLYESKKQALSLASYHFRELEKEGCLAVIEEHPRRGAVEKVYTGCSRVFFSDEDFENMPLERRAELSKTTFQGLVARTDGAIRTGTFDKRTDRHLTWKATHVDPQGWEDIKTIFGDAYMQAEDARQEAAARMADPAHDDDGEPIPITFGMLAFESPSPQHRYESLGGDQTLPSPSVNLLGDVEGSDEPRQTEAQDELGLAVSALRKKMRMSPRTLAARSGLSASWISRLEAGKHEPTWGDLRQLAKGLGVSMEELTKVVEELEQD